LEAYRPVRKVLAKDVKTPATTEAGNVPAAAV
jgi:hypothetical protein